MIPEEMLPGETYMEYCLRVNTIEEFNPCLFELYVPPVSDSKLDMLTLPSYPVISKETVNILLKKALSIVDFDKLATIEPVYKTIYVGGDWPSKKEEKQINIIDYYRVFFVKNNSVGTISIDAKDIKNEEL